MPDEQVGAGVHHRAREGDEKIGRQEAILAAFVGVNRDDGVVREAGGILHDCRDLVEILLQGIGRHARRCPHDKAVAEIVEGVARARRPSGRRGRHGAQRRHVIGGDRGRGRKAQRVEAGTGRHIAARAPGA